MIEVLQPGLFTTVQDLGRFGHRHLGVPVSGVMDQASAINANSILGNRKDAAVLEITMKGPELKFNRHTTIAVTGAPFEIQLNSKTIHMNTRIAIQPNDVLVIGQAKSGMRCYLAVVGGFQTPLVLGSRSYYQGITASRVLQKGDTLPFNNETALEEVDGSKKSSQYGEQELEVYRGPEFELLPKAQVADILQNFFKVSAQSNRMAYLLEHCLELTAEEIRTGPVQPGTVQLTPSGSLVVLMRDAQTTGGYSRILQLSESAIDQLSQKRGGEVIQFKLTEIVD